MLSKRALASQGRMFIKPECKPLLEKVFFFHVFEIKVITENIILFVASQPISHRLKQYDKISSSYNSIRILLLLP